MVFCIAAGVEHRHGPARRSSLSPAVAPPDDFVGLTLRTASLLAALIYLNASLAASAEPSQVTFPGANGVTLKGWLYAPDAPGPHRAIVAMHGCGGLWRKGKPSARHEDWGQRFAGWDLSFCFPTVLPRAVLVRSARSAIREVSPARERVDDANAALDYLSAKADVKPQAISLMGWSNGGSTVLYAVEPRHAPRGGPDFAKAVALYPGCRIPLESAVEDPHAAVGAYRRGGRLDARGALRRACRGRESERRTPTS